MPMLLVSALVSSIAAPAEPRVSTRSEKGEVRPAPSFVVPREPEPTCVVQPGEQVSDVAARIGVSTASLLTINGLAWRSFLTPGDALRIPQARYEPPTAVSPELAHHAVSDGETAAAIAGAHGVSTAALLLANGLSRGSRITPGQHLVIPLRARRAPSGEVLALTGEMLDHAWVIECIGLELGLPEDAIVIGLVAAMQDSALRNLDCGEWDAQGLFQQRPSAGWGSAAQVRNPEHAVRAFFGGPSSPVAGRVTGLLDVAGWEFMSVGEAAYAVQRTGSPAAYEKWESSARSWLGVLRTA